MDKTTPPSEKGNNKMALTAEQTALVKATAPAIKQHGKAITTVFYQRLLSAEPGLKNMFSLRNQQSGAQQAALAEAVFAYAAHIDDLGRLAAAVDRIAHKHASLFVRPEHYPIVGRHLVAAFAEVLGDALTQDVADAWVAAYAQLADVFIGRESQLYEPDAAAGWGDWRAFRVVRREAEADGVFSLYVEPRDGRPLRSYRPGQYVSVRIPIPELDGLFQCRQFSLSTAPAAEGADMTQYRFSVKREHTVDGASVRDMAEGKVPGLVSNKLFADYHVGAALELSPPSGEFFFDGAASPPTAPVVLLSIGVGATPLLAILEAIVADAAQASRPVSWVHAARHPGAVCFARPVADMAARRAGLRSFVFAKTAAGAGVDAGADAGADADADAGADAAASAYDVEGRLTMERVEAEGLLHLDDAAAGYYICGPPDWMVQARAWLLDRGVARERVFVELFGTGEVH